MPGGPAERASAETQGSKATSWSTARGRRRARCVSSRSITRPICCAPTGSPPTGRRRTSSRRSSTALRGAAARRRGGAVGLCQGRADAARHSRGDRRARASSASRSIVDPKGTDFSHLSRRDADDAEPQGTRRGDAGTAVATDADGSAAAAETLAASVESEAVLVTLQRGRHDAVRTRGGRRSMCRPIR